MLDIETLENIADYLWELKCQNEWKRDTTLRNIEYLEDLQETWNKVYFTLQDHKKQQKIK